MEKAEEFQKNICFFGCIKAFDFVGHKKTGKFLERWEYEVTLPVSWETCMQVKKKQNQMCNNWLVQNWERSTYCHPAYLSCMQSTSWEMLGWMNPKLGVKITGWNINILR